ncbi:pectinesterase family protein [Streptomyces sp. AK08-02]|uniref:pectinesterase family protein n=1 Tax=Streptomyces sp. AK08-02 TaxID=3028654 RepID=UPI0029BCD4AE|nr:pectinesterase family protein [Streptomyces sp. AK08-02]MDX3748759.1 pectinesterase family protein [Streptomyces sp. AK08-02]
MYLRRGKRARSKRPRWRIAAPVGVAALVVLGGVATAANVVGGSGGDQATGVKAGTYTLAVAKSGLCLDLVGGGSFPGTQVQQWGCAPGQGNQKWTLVDRGSGRFAVKSVAGGLCLDVTGGSTASGTRLQQWGCGNDQANQLWKLTPTRDNTYQIVNVGNGLCVSDAGASTAPGAAVIQETCSTNSNKRWSLTPVAAASSTSTSSSNTAQSPATSGTTITVAADGSGDATTVQAAIDKVPVNNTKPVTVAIKKGTYRGVFTVPGNKPFVTLKGLGSAASDVVLVQNHGAGTKKADGTTYGTSGSATAFVDGHDFSASNLTFSNDFDTGTNSTGQAVALSLSADRAVLTNVRILGHQDTLLVNNSARAYFLKSYVEGTVDFIFGGGIAVFDQNEIHQVGSGGYLTAASTPAERAYGYLFYKSNITGPTATKTGSLGRPWRQGAQVLYRESTLGSFVNTGKPWSDMSDSVWTKARFTEYKNTGAGATVNANRPQLSDSQAANYTPAKYLAGSDGWNPIATATAGTSTGTTTPTTGTATGTVCKPTAYGAKADGTTKDTAALQKAINACAGKGGSVELTSGKYLSGALTLPGDLTFRIDSGATLLASQDAADYASSGSKLAPLLAGSGKNLTITGGGTIDGQGAPWWAKTRAEKAAGQTLSSRPGLVSVNDASNLRITGITLRNAPNVHLTLKKVTTAVLDKLTISAPSDSPNTDGIDVWSSSGVAVTGSTIDVGDDNIAIDSSTANGPAHDISLSGCTILHGHGLSIGSFTAGGIYNINIHDNTLKGTTAGVRIKTARDRGGEVHDITYKNLTMTDVTTPIQIVGYYPKVPADGDAAQAVTSNTPNYHDITIADITATGAREAGQIVGVPERPITGLTLTSVTISAKTGLTVRNATVRTNSTTVKPASGSAYLVQSRATVN